MSLNNYANVLLNQLVTILNQLNNEQYAMELEILSKGSIGKHVRHILEFYECMLNGIGSGKINYYKRQRNISLETDVDFAINCIHTLTDAIMQLKNPKTRNKKGGCSSMMMLKIISKFCRKYYSNLNHFPNSM
jgi:hypothetical protein